MTATTPLAAEPRDLDSNEILRYSRHLILPEFGLEAQRRLKGSSVLLVGAGGLGSPVGLYLAAAGVGRLGIVDFDVVDATNLQRQVIHGTADVGRPKLASARDRIQDLNPNVHVDTYETRLTSGNALDIAADYDVIVDGTDNFATRYLVNDTSVLLGKPNVYGSIFRFEGQASVLATPEGPCYRCLFREPPPPGLVPSCAEGGVLGVLPGLVGVIQATETIKLLTGVGEPLIGRLLLIDALGMKFRTLKLHKDPLCPACGTREIQALQDYERFCGLDAGQGNDGELAEMLPTELSERLAQGQDIDVIDVREPQEWALGNIPSARLIPLGTLPSALSALDGARDIVVYCKGGVRSARAARQLQAAGFRRVWNLTGGILRWSTDVDPTIPQY